MIREPLNALTDLGGRGRRFANDRQAGMARRPLASGHAWSAPDTRDGTRRSCELLHKHRHVAFAIASGRRTSR